MSGMYRVRVLGLVTLQMLVVLLGLFGARPSVAEGIWSKGGKAPATNAVDELRVPSPDRTRSVVGTREGLRLDEGAGESSVALPVVALLPLWEVVWAPDSLFVAVNASDGGAVGTWDATIFNVRPTGSIATFLVSSLVRRAAHTFAKCESPEDVNVALVGWEDNGAIAHVVAEVPPHSSCKNMGSLRGYRVAVKSERILESLGESSLRKRWSAELGSRFKR